MLTAMGRCILVLCLFCGLFSIVSLKKKSNVGQSGHDSIMRTFCDQLGDDVCPTLEEITDKVPTIFTGPGKKSLDQPRTVDRFHPCNRYSTGLGASGWSDYIDNGRCKLIKKGAKKPHYLQRISDQTSQCPYQKYVAGREGVITSPNYGSVDYYGEILGYDLNQYCTWIILGEEGAVVAIKVEILNLYSSNGDCFNPFNPDSFLIIFDGTDTRQNRILRACTDADVYSEIVSSSRSVYIIFSSAVERPSEDDGYHYSGFKLSYRVINETDLSEGYIDADACGYDGPMVFSGEFGRVQTPGFGTIFKPQYPNDAVCSWQINVSPEMIIRLEIFILRIELQLDCLYDYLEIRDGPSLLSPVLARLCGDIEGKSFITSGNSSYVKFFTDYSVTDEGALMYFRAIEPPTNQSLIPDLEPEQRFFYKDINSLTLFSLTDGYPTDLQNIYYITLEDETQQVVLSVLFAIEYHQSCAYDYLEFYEGGELNVDYAVAYVCGFVDELFFFAFSSNKATVSFYSDYVTTENGFMIQISPQHLALNACSSDSQPTHLLNTLAGTISPYGYPDDMWSSQVNCSWWVEATDPKLIFEIAFLVDKCVNPEINETLVVHNPIQDTDSLVLCEESLIVVSHQVLVVYDSGDTGDHKGFLARFRFRAPDVNSGMYEGENSGSCNSTTKPEEIVIMNYNGTTIQSLGYQDGYNYMNNMDCWWLATQLYPEQILTLTIRTRIEEPIDDKCVFDKLEIYHAECDGAPCDTTLLTLIDTYCGQHNDTELIVAAPALFIRFVSDEVYTDLGFSIEINVGSSSDDAASPWNYPGCNSTYTEMTLAAGIHVLDDQDDLSGPCIMFNVSGVTATDAVVFSFYEDERDEVFFVGTDKHGFCINDFVWFGAGSNDTLAIPYSTKFVACGRQVPSKLLYEPGEIPVIMYYNQHGIGHGPRMSIDIIPNFNDSFTIECEEAFVVLADSPTAEETISFVVDNLQCQSVYVTSNNSHVKYYQVEIHSLNIEPSDFCLYDRVTILESPFDSDNETDLQYFYCGDLDHIRVTAEGERIQITYESDYSIPTLDEDFHHINITVKPGRAPVAPEIANCGYANESMYGEYIVGGQEAIAGSWPWQVGLFYQGSFICGGSVISSEYVLTAAHCILDIDNIQVSDYQVLIHAHNIITPEETADWYDVTEILPSSKYIAGNFRDDVAILVVNMTDVTPVCLTATEPDVGAPVMVTGWGDTSYGGSSTAYLMEVEVEIISRQQCTAPEWKYTPSEIGPETICAGLPEGGKDSCQGDSGGPLVQNVGGRWYLVGVVSRGFECGRAKAPGLYVNIARYQQWMTHRTRGAYNGQASGVSRDTWDLWK